MLQAFAVEILLHVVRGNLILIRRDEKQINLIHFRFKNDENMKSFKFRLCELFSKRLENFLVEMIHWKSMAG
jgi:hypothetical protein